jgi:hypothetical protein
MNWADITKINNKPIETIKISITNDDTNDKKDNIIDINIKDKDDEFDKKYLSKISDLKFEFKEYIDYQALPFLNNLNTKNYNFYDFIKNNSENYKNVIRQVEKENEEYLKQLEEDEKKQMEDDYYEID